MFSSTKKKLVAVVTLTMMLMALGTVAATADVDKVTICHKEEGKNPQTKEVPNAALGGHLGHGDDLGPCDGNEDPGEDPDDDPDDGEEDGDECKTVSIDIGIEVDVCLLVEVDADELLEVLHLLHLVDVHDKLQWLHGHISLGDRIDWLLELIDLDDVYEHFGWLEPDGVFGLIGFLGDGIGDEADGLLDNGILDGGDGGGDGDCNGLVNVCNNVSGNTITDVVNVCTIDVGATNGQGDDANNDCALIDAGDGLGDDGILELVEIGNVLKLTDLF